MKGRYGLAEGRLRWRQECVGWWIAFSKPTRLFLPSTLAVMVAGRFVALRNSGAVHLLLTDMVLPEMGGAELAAFFSHGPRAIPVLCMSGYFGSRLEAGLPAFIQKPFTIDALLSRIRQLLAAPAPATETLSTAAAVAPEPRP